jgi:hypothetical protein
MYEYWSWWMAGLALAGLSIGFRLLTSRSLGVSGSWTKIVFWKQEQEKDIAADALLNNKAAASNALLAAALAEFGDDAVDKSMDDDTAAAQTPAATAAPRQPVPWTAHLVFLLSMLLGAFLWAIQTSNFQIQFELSQLHTQLSGAGWQTAFVLFMGGLFVGIGTQMAGGCASGHGLSGCSNFAPASLIATGVFFGTAVLVAMSVGVFL